MVQVLGGEAVTLGAEQQSRSIVFGQADDAARDIARRRELPIVRARPRSRARDEPAVADRLGDRGDDARLAQNIVRARRQCIGFRVRKRAGPDQDQVAERHVLHGTRNRPDISGMAGIDEDDANVVRHALLFYRQLMQPLLNIGMRAARRAGDLIVRSLSRLDSIKIDSKGRNDFVTDIDRKAEADIIATIRRSHPQHAFLAEESGRTGDNEFVWIIDPLDGTTNFLHGFPTFAVSIAVEHKGRLQHAVVYDPMRQEFFTASRGDGAQLEGKKIRVSTQRTLEGSLIGTGFPFRAGAHVDEYLAMLKVIMAAAAGVRRPGAASLDLAYVAAGRIDGFWEFGLSPWDTAAGALLIQEAGGRVGTATGAEYSLGANIVAGNPKVYQALLDALGPLTPAALRT